MKYHFALLSLLFLPACSVVGDNGVESAPYTLVKSDEANSIEIRNYESMVLVSASMKGDGRNSAFRKLFGYISGDNQGSNEIAMTAPVFMDSSANDAQEGTEIAMTAPVFMSENSSEPMMSFVMPSTFTLQSTPKPTDPDIKVSQISDYKVAVIRFSGTLGESNVEKQTDLLLEWMQKNGYQPKSEPITAGYNGPLTLPMFRHNEVLIEIQ